MPSQGRHHHHHRQHVGVISPKSSLVLSPKTSELKVQQCQSLPRINAAHPRSPLGSPLNSAKIVFTPSPPQNAKPSEGLPSPRCALIDGVSPQENVVLSPRPPSSLPTPRILRDSEGKEKFRTAHFLASLDDDEDTRWLLTSSFDPQGDVPPMPDSPNDSFCEYGGKTPRDNSPTRAQCDQPGTSSRSNSDGGHLSPLLSVSDLKFCGFGAYASPSGGASNDDGDKHGIEFCVTPPEPPLCDFSVAPPPPPATTPPGGRRSSIASFVSTLRSVSHLSSNKSSSVGGRSLNDASISSLTNSCLNVSNNTMKSSLLSKSTTNSGKGSTAVIGSEKRTLMIKEQVEKRGAMKAEIEAKQMLAQDRREQHSQSSNIDRAKLLLSLIAFAQSSIALCLVVESFRGNILQCLQWLPSIRLHFRRLVRRVRLAAMARESTRLTPAQFRAANEHVFGHLSDAHLLQLADSARLSYYFPGEAMVYKGVRGETDLLFIAQGTANACMSPGAALTGLGQGDCFGEEEFFLRDLDRSATVVCDSPCLVWSISADIIPKLALSPSILDLVQLAVADQRASKLMAMYQRVLTPNQIKNDFTFILKGVRLSTIAKLAHDSVKRVALPGSALSSPLMSRNGESRQWCFVLKGSVKVSWGHSPRGAPFTLRDGMSLAEAFCHLVTLPHGRQIPTTAFSVSPQESFAIIVHGPLLLNISPQLLGIPLPLCAVASTSCDVMSIDRDIMLSHDVLELNNIRTNCLQLRTPFISLPLPAEIVAAILKGPSLSASVRKSISLPLQANSKSPSAQPQLLEALISSMAPRTIAANESLLFDESNSNAYFILNGQVQLNDSNSTIVTVSRSSEGCPVVLWPEVSFLYFGSIGLKAKAVTMLDVLVVSRRNFLLWLQGTLSRDEEKLMKQSMATYLYSTMRIDAHFSVGKL